jgi:hypothetical protein
VKTVRLQSRSGELLVATGVAGSGERTRRGKSTPLSKPRSTRRPVVFPDPFGSRKPVTVPPPTSKLRSSTATELKRLVSPLSRSPPWGRLTVRVPEVHQGTARALHVPAAEKRNRQIRATDHEPSYDHPYSVSIHPHARFRRRFQPHVVAARKAATVTGTSTSPVTARATSACRSCPQSLPVLISRCPVSIT